MTSPPDSNEPIRPARIEIASNNPISTMNNHHTNVVGERWVEPCAITNSHKHYHSSNNANNHNHSQQCNNNNHSRSCGQGNDMIVPKDFGPPAVPLSRNNQMWSHRNNYAYTNQIGHGNYYI